MFRINHGEGRFLAFSLHVSRTILARNLWENPALVP
jgi:hypothetical protein